MLAAAAAAAVVVGASPAGAHAALEATEPPAGARLDEPPARVGLRFSEPVEASLGAVRVFDAEGRRVDDGRVRADGRSVTTGLGRLDPGPYVVTWRVTSVDAHPVEGAFGFGVEADPAGHAAIAERRTERGGDRLVGALYAAARAAAFAALLVGAGAVVVGAWIWPAGAPARVRRLAVAAFAALAAASAAAAVLHGSYGAGLGLAEGLRGEVLRGALATRYGQAAAARLALAAAGALLAARSRSPFGPLAAAVAAAATVAVAGHASSGAAVPLALAADVVHLAAAAVWVGGLATLVVARPVPQAVLARFSATATWAVALVVGSGAAQAVRQVGGVAALRTTDYGRLLSVKLLVVALVLGAAALARSALRRGQPRRAGRLMALEVGGAAAVVVLTALLVQAPPARQVVDRPQSGRLVAEGIVVDYTVAPARPGRNEVHLYALTPSGALLDLPEVRAELALPAAGIARVDVPLQRVAPGHWASYAAPLPIPGRWELVVEARTGEFDQVDLVASVHVR